MELVALSLERELESGIIFGIGTWSLDWALKLGGLKQFKTSEPCYAIRRPAEADYKFDNCNAKTKYLANNVVMQDQGELCRADPPSQTTSLKTFVI